MMDIRIAGLLILLLFSQKSPAQKYRSVSSSVHFFSDAPMEDIEATNLDGQSAIDLSTGEIVFSIPIKSFEFEKSLMQEHFNENYLESDKYPTATFQGKVTGFNKDAAGWQKAKAKGSMNIHGEDNELSVEGEVMIEEGSIEIKSIFPIALEDYNIKIPKVVFYNIAEVVEVTITFTYEPID
jgi:polyisoprenoid-binding protein YceI